MKMMNDRMIHGHGFVLGGAHESGKGGYIARSESYGRW